MPRPGTETTAPVEMSHRLAGEMNLDSTPIAIEAALGSRKTGRASALEEEPTVGNDPLCRRIAVSGRAEATPRSR
jgi:hypothetical protein